jgi:hypothetical protein
MKQIFTRSIFKVFAFFSFYCLTFLGSSAQVNLLNIGSSQQLNSPATTFNAWKVSAMSQAMQTAVCVGNTNGWDCPFTYNQIQPVALNHDAAIVAYTDLANNSWPTGGGVFTTYLSCFPVNTIFNPTVPQDVFDNYTMTLTRSFVICSQSSEQVNFNLKISADNSVLSVIVDAGLPSQKSLLASPVSDAMQNPISISTSTPLSLAPGLHTISVKASNYQTSAQNARICYINNLPMQMNPMGAAISGTISTINSVLVNSDVANITNNIAGPDNICALKSTTLTASNQGGIWLSSDTTVAKINQSGVVTGIKPGVAKISYTIGTGDCANTATHPLAVTNCHCEDSCSWGKTGNGDIHGWNFIGSINNAAVKISTNNTTRIIVPADGIQSVANARTYSPLLIGTDGTLYKSDYNKTDSLEVVVGDNTQQINDLKAEVENLKKLLTTLMQTNNYCPVVDPGKNSLVIAPTPFTNSSDVVAIFDIQDKEFKGSATLQITELSGRLIKSLDITQAKGQISIGRIESVSTVIIFNIIVKGRVVISKRSVKL